MPREIVDRLNQEINAALREPGLVSRLEGMGVQVGPLRAPEALDAFAAEERVRFKGLVEMSGARME